MELFAYAAKLAEDKRAQDPRGADLISVLSEAEVDGEQLTQLEIDLFFMLLTVAGNETTRNLISHGLLALLDHPDQLERVRAHRELLPGAVDEMLRCASPVMHFRRTATRDLVLGDQRVSEGDKVVIWYASANRDEAVFEDPMRFDVERSPNEHVAFGGGGPHFCLGANLARMEIRVIFDELLDRWQGLELTGAPERLRSNFINGIKHIPLKFSPA
jgi:cholest-4-en-3-one 26-monooxygenase